MINPQTAQRPHILLVGNYLPDGQRSMQRFTEQLAQGLRQHGFQIDIFRPPVIIGKLGAKTHGYGKWLGYIDKYILAPIFLRRAIGRLPKPRIVHICDHSNAIYTSSVAKETHLVTCHDLLAVRSALGEIPQNRLRVSGKKQQDMILKGLQSSRCIASVSAATRDDVQRIIGAHSNWAHLIPNALDDAFIAAARTPRLDLQEALPNPLKLPDDSEIYVHIGGEKWYKNRAAVLRIFASIAVKKPHAQLAIVGNVFSPEQLAANQCEGLTSRIHYLHGISDEALRALYAHAACLLFPSWIEGFGWPILEAQACGCPVATLDREPMNELNATKQLCLPADCESKEWASDAAERINSLQQIVPEELQNFAARYTNAAAIDAYSTLYQSILLEQVISK
ncbi:glycosyltransferase [Coraliomargarita sp. W4R53]